MVALRPENDPISFMSFLAEADRTASVMQFPDTMSWCEAKAIMGEELEKLIPFDNYFFISLGDESQLTDDSAHFIIRTETPEDKLIVEAFMFNFKIEWPKGE